MSYGARVGHATSLTDGVPEGFNSHCSMQYDIISVKLWFSLYVDPPVVSSTTAAVRFGLLSQVNMWSWVSGCLWQHGQIAISFWGFIMCELILFFRSPNGGRL